ncbi:MAG: hypothetical protein LBJ63_07325 [Prevotellaceae bacterium]|jgi:hypothetical protein|nr:hypothetical protein [Prevotellaceae bacterium]
METDSLILIKGASYSNVKEELHQWTTLYIDDLGTDIVFNLYSSGKENHIIKVDERIDNDHFFYLVNYLGFSDNTRYKVNVEGFITASKYKQFINKKLMVYINDKDTEGDNVFAVTEDNETFKVDFGGKIKKIKTTKTYRHLHISDINLLSDPEIIKPDKKKIDKYKQEKSVNLLKKRFKIILLTVLILFVISIPLSFINKANFTFALCAFGVGFGAWFFLDYEMLRINKYYGYCFLIAFSFFIYCLLLQYIVKLQFINDINGFDILASIPISLLITQKPLRFCFKKIIGREPTTDRDARKLTADGVYSMLWILSTILCIYVLHTMTIGDDKNTIIYDKHHREYHFPAGSNSTIRDSTQIYIPDMPQALQDFTPHRLLREDELINRDSML